MVTSQSEELVLIDFGRSEFLDERDRYIYHKLAPFKYINDNGVRVKEDINHPFCHGTIGYAAPEAFRAAIDDSFPLTLLNDKSEDKTNGFEIGRMSIESDSFFIWGNLLGMPKYC